MLPADDTDPVDAFVAVWERVQRTAPEGLDPATVALSTADAAGSPSVRMVLLRGVDREGFVFHTNYRSRKAHDLETNPRAALCGFWYWLKQQVRVEGRVVHVTADESDAYFASRPRGSQLGAWASPQSTPIASRAELETRLNALDALYTDRPVPRPDFWGGYRLIPDRIEFWEEGQSRLHDRFLFTRGSDGWVRQRLAP
jgi:pyridoxamine 5'-phosphate oxidase